MTVLSPIRALVGRVPIPDVLPGRFFVLEFERPDRTYVLTVDDTDRTSYALGDDIERIRALFTSRGHPAPRVNDLIDRAREFGACQYVPSGAEHIEDRVIQLLPREARQPKLQLFETPSNGWNNL